VAVVVLAQQDNLHLPLLWLDMVVQVRQPQ
jgi:hypothetical protein